MTPAAFAAERRRLRKISIAMIAGTWRTQQLSIGPRPRSAANQPHASQGRSPKKKWEGRLKQDLDKDFLNNLGLHACCTEIILHCVSVSNQLQQWTNFCTKFSLKSGAAVPCVPPHYTPDASAVVDRTLITAVCVQNDLVSKIGQGLN